MVLWFDIYAKIKLYITIDIYKFFLIWANSVIFRGV